MRILPFTALACPLDGAPLHRQGAAWQCAAGHSFDIASQGYTHLLPVQNKRSRDPGDSKEMIAARRRFLEAGVYQPIAQAVAETTLAGLSPANTPGCLDAGCGEGYYLRQLATAAKGRGQPLALMGLDISKWAVLAGQNRTNTPDGWSEAMPTCRCCRPRCNGCCACSAFRFTRSLPGCFSPAAC